MTEVEDCYTRPYISPGNSLFVNQWSVAKGCQHLPEPPRLLRGAGAVAGPDYWLPRLKCQRMWRRTDPPGPEKRHGESTFFLAARGQDDNSVSSPSARREFR